MFNTIAQTTCTIFFITLPVVFVLGVFLCIIEAIRASPKGKNVGQPSEEDEGEPAAARYLLVVWFAPFWGQLLGSLAGGFIIACLFFMDIVQEPIFEGKDIAIKIAIGMYFIPLILRLICELPVRLLQRDTEEREKTLICLEVIPAIIISFFVTLLF